MHKFSIHIVLLFFALSLSAQEKSNDVKGSISINGLIGGQMTHKTISLKSGFNADISAYKPITDRFNAGIGLAYIIMKDEKFIPIYVSTFNLFDNNLFYKFKVGYSFAFIPKYDNLDMFSYKGGLFTEPQFGYHISLCNNNEKGLFVGIKLINQFGKLKINSLENNDFDTERLHFLLTGLSLNLQF